MKNIFTNTARIFFICAALMFVSGNVFALPFGHRYVPKQADQFIVTDINTDFEVSVEWGEGDWTTSSFGYGTSIDGSGWVWVDLPWFADSGSYKRCVTSVSIQYPGKYYYAYRIVKAGITSYSFGSDEWSETSENFSPISSIDVGVYSIDNGDWTAGEIWNHGDAPTSTDNVGIYHSVHLNGTTEVGSLSIQTIGSLSCDEHEITISPDGSLNNFGTFNCGTGTVTFLKNGNVNGNVIFYKVKLGNSVAEPGGMVNFGSNSTISNTLTIFKDGKIDTKAPTFLNTSTLVYSINDSYDRGLEWSATSGAGYPNNVILDNATTLNMVGISGENTPQQCGGDLTIKSGSIFSMVGMNVPVTVLGTVTNESFSTISLSNNIGGDLKIQKNFVDYGTFLANEGAIHFIGGNNQEIRGIGTIDIPHLRINKSSSTTSVKLFNSLLCEGSSGRNAIEIDGVNSILELNGKTLTIGKAGVNSTFNIGVLNSGKIKGSTSSNLTIYGTGNFGTLLFEQTNSSNKTISTFIVDRTSSGIVTIGNALTANTLTITNGVVVIPSGGSLITNSTGVNAIVERNINNADWTNWQDGWHFISSPVASQAISPAFTTDPYDFYTWHEASNQWVNFKNTTVAPTWNDVNGSTNFTVGKGYMVAYDEAGTKSFAGTLNVSNVSVSGLVITGTTQTNRSWHLLGNPYSSALTWDNSWARTNIAGVAKIWNEAGQAYSDLTSSPSSSVIPATNGFMVQVVSGTGSLTIPAAKRVHSSQAFYKSSSEEFPGFKLIASPVDYSSFQESLVLVDANASNDYDLMLDGEFLAGYAPQFYSRITDMNLSTNSLPFIDETTQIPFGFVKNTASEYTIELKESIEGYKVFLKDLKANVDHNLTANPVYAFTSLEGDDANRFLLHFESTLGTDDTEKPEQLSMYYNNGSVYVSGAAGKAELFVRNMLGQVVIQQTVNGDGLQVVNTGNLADGVYVVSLVGSGSTKSQKIVIK